MWSLAQYTYQTTSSSSGSSAGVLLVYLVILVVTIVAMWKIFEKAGQAGWKAIIPIYSSIIQLRIIGMSGWYVLLYLVPLVNFIFAIYVAYKLALCFGYGIGMTILELLWVGFLILGFGSAKYVGPDGGGAKKHAPAA
jgi:hypothetical protein